MCGSVDEGMGRVLFGMLVASPLAGVAVGGAGVGALHLMRRRFGVRRDYESLYSLGIAFAVPEMREGPRPRRRAEPSLRPTIHAGPPR